MSRRLLICSPGIPHKTQGASTVLFYHYIDHLRQAGFNILNILLLQPDNFSHEALTEYTMRMEAPGSFVVLPCQADTFVLRRRFDIRLDVQLVAETRQKAEAFRPDLMVCFDLLSAWVVGPVSANTKLAWLGDLNFQTEWYHAWYAVREGTRPFVKLPLDWYRAYIWKKIYWNVLSQMDSVIVSSHSSVRHLKRLGIASTYQPYPWPNHSSIRQTDLTKRPSIPSFLFFGSLTGLGSRSAFHFIFDELYPHLIRLWGQRGFRISIAGMRGLHPWIEAEIARKPELRYLGFVDDLDSVIASCHAVLAPIDVPVGNRSRIVTAMAKGGLVIAHRNASLGNPGLVDGQTCYLANNADQFVERMQDAFEHPQQAETIIDHARACYEECFRPDVAAGKLLKELLRVNGDKAKTAASQ